MIEIIIEIHDIKIIKMPIIQDMGQFANTSLIFL